MGNLRQAINIQKKGYTPTGHNLERIVFKSLFIA